MLHMWFSIQAQLNSQVQTVYDSEASSQGGARHDYDSSGDHRERRLLVVRRLTMDFLRFRPAVTQVP